MSETTKNYLDGRKDYQPIDPALFTEMTRNYKDSLTGDDDTESVWISIYDLMDLISHNRANGIRIYYGRHGKDHDLYPGRHNLIFVATRDHQNPHNPCCEYSSDLLGEEHMKTTFGSSTFTGMGMDHGPLCPPRCTK
jgi:hypothetical protein